MRSDPHHTAAVGGRIFQVRILRHRRARRYVLRVGADDSLHLTVPRGASIAGGLQFAERQGDWIARERIRRGRRTDVWREGTAVWFRGRLEPLRVVDAEILCGAERCGPAAGDVGVQAAVEARLAAIAQRELPVRCLELAAAHGLVVARVSVRNQRSRWGACSARGTVTLNWRLVQMSPAVSDYIILHELAHLRQPNHSPRFRRAVGALCPTWRESEAWLRRHGREIL